MVWDGRSGTLIFSVWLVGVDGDELLGRTEATEKWHRGRCLLLPGRGHACGGERSVWVCVNLRPSLSRVWDGWTLLFRAVTLTWVRQLQFLSQPFPNDFTSLSYDMLLLEHKGAYCSQF